MRNVIAVMLCLALLMTSSGCAVAGGRNVENSRHDAGKIVVDASGDVLQIPESGDLSIASVYAVAVPFIVALELSDQVVAINYKSKFWPDNVDGLAKAGSVGRGIVDLELLASCNPDVFIHRSNDPRTVKAVNDLGIPVISIRAENIEEIMDTVDLLGRYFGAESRADEVKDWMNKKFDKIGQIVQSIPEDKRLTAIVMGGDIGVVAGGDMLQSWMLEHAGAVSLTTDLQGDGNADGNLVTAWANIGVEKIFELNPDVIFCTSSAALNYTVKDMLESSLWSEIEAVKTGRVMVIPAKWDSWDLPGVNCTLGTMWMLHKLYPEYLSAKDLQAEIDEYYTFMFGRTFDKSYLGYDLSE